MFQDILEKLEEESTESLGRRIVVWEASCLLSQHISCFQPAYTTKTCTSPEEASCTSVEITGNLRSFVLFFLFFLIVVLMGCSISQVCNDSGVSCFYKTSAAFIPVTQLLLCSSSQTHYKPCPTLCFLLLGSVWASLCSWAGELMETPGQRYSSYSTCCSFPGIW